MMWCKVFTLTNSFQAITAYPEIGNGNFNITHSHFIDSLLFKGS